MEKEALRAEIRERDKEHSEEEQANWSQNITQALLSDARLCEDSTLMLYWNLSYEVNLSALAEVWIAESKTLCLPRIEGAFLKGFQISTWSRDLLERHERFGIWEPRADAVAVKLSDIDCVCVPGRAFDTQGYRLGHGHGFYDRFLGQVPRAYKIGICFKYQLLEKIPRKEHDIKMDRVISLT